MVADVQSWLDNPASNFGWLVLGDESTIATAKRFDTRESASPPVLTIQFISGPRVIPTPRPRPISSAASALIRTTTNQVTAVFREAVCSLRSCWRLCLRPRLRGIGVRFGECTSFARDNYNCDNDHKTDSRSFFASPAFSAGEYERERLGRHRRRMRANPGWAVHKHVDIWRYIPGLNNS